MKMGIGFKWSSWEEKNSGVRAKSEQQLLGKWVSSGSTGQDVKREMAE